MDKEQAIETLRANYPDACYEQLREAVDAAIEALKQPEIVRCGECKHLRRWISANHQFCDITACKVSEDEFCNRAKRRTDGSV